MARSTARVVSSRELEPGDEAKMAPAGSTQLAALGLNINDAQASLLCKVSSAAITL